MSYNGHKNWVHWNVSLWLSNDENLYHLMNEFKDQATRYMAAKNFLDYLNDQGITKTPDGAKYSLSAIQAAMRD
jgi:dTDP-4-amino-4,6-dideoxygalactose transaminase